MAKKKNVIDFYGFEELLKQTELAETEVDRAIVSAMSSNSEYVRNEMRSFMAKTPRKKTGRTNKSLKPIKVESYRGKYTSKVGFDISKGGIASVFWQHGSPRREPATKFIDKAFGNKKRFHKIQEEAIMKALSRIKGGKANG